MLRENAIVMVDTNILLDYYLPTRPSSKASTKVLTMCANAEVEVVFALRSLYDVFWQVQQDSKDWVRKVFDPVPERYAKAAIAEAWQCVEHMLTIGTPIGADVTDVRRAIELRSVHPDFEDDMVLAAAERAHVDYLVTSDERLIAKATVAALAPQDMLALLQAGI